MLPKSMRRGIRELLIRSRYRRYFLPRYPYMFYPGQLMFLCACVKEAAGIDGAMAEIGCASGNTTIFLNTYLDELDIEKKYYAVDTFSGFVEEDVEVEINERGKQAFADRYASDFTNNKQEWFDLAIKKSGISRVQSIKADVNNFDLTSLGPLSFCLLDVDLYRPIKKALPELYDVMTPGGILLVDNCDLNESLWDGADQAYREFMDELGRPADIRETKIGVIRKV